MATAASSKSPFRQTMDDGNAAFREAQLITPDFLKPPRAENAVRLYDQALSLAASPTERSSAFKNKCKAHTLIALCPEAASESRGYHFAEALSAGGNALHVAVASQAQQAAWIADLFQSISDMLAAGQQCGTANIHGLYAALEAAARQMTQSSLVRSLAAIELVREAQRRAACRSAAKEFPAMKAVIGKVDGIVQSLDEFLVVLEESASRLPPEVIASVKEQAAEVTLGIATSRREAECNWHLAQGHEARNRAGSEVVETMTFHLHVALDHYRLAMSTSAGKEVPLEAEAKASIGIVLSDFFKNKEAAHTHFVDAIRLVYAAERYGLRHRPWYRRALNAIADRQKEQREKEAAEREAELKPHLEALKPQLTALEEAARKGPAALIDHIYKTYKPGGLSDPPTTAPEPAPQEQKEDKQEETHPPEDDADDDDAWETVSEDDDGGDDDEWETASEEDDDEEDEEEEDEEEEDNADDEKDSEEEKADSKGGAGANSQPTSANTPQALSRLAVKLVLHFHPDKSTGLDRQTQILHEEVTRHLTNIINRSKI